MSWRALVMHRKEPVAMSARLHLLSEFEDVVVRLASSPEEALTALERESIDLVLCEYDPGDPAGMKLREAVRQSPSRARTPFVMIISCPPEGWEEALIEAGEEFWLQAPFSAHQLREAVIKAFNPRNRRRYARLSVPGVRAVLSVGGVEVEAEVHNLSLRGMLCQFEFPPEAGDLLGPVWVGLSFSPAGVHPPAFGIEACLLRLSVDCFHDSLMPRIVRAAWKFVLVPPAAEETLGLVIEEAARGMDQMALGPEGLAV